MIFKTDILAKALKTLMCAAVFLSVPHYAAAITLDACREEVEELDMVLPEGITDSWQKIVLDHLALVNSYDDPEALEVIYKQTWAQYEAYRNDPDPDGDGYARAHEVVRGETSLLSCLITARQIELYAQDDAQEAEPEVQESEADLTAAPAPVDNPSNWFQSAAYPASAVNEGRQGVVKFDVTVDVDGSVLGCQATGPAGSADLEEATCNAIFANGQFDPAMDRAGNYVIGEYSNQIRWQIP